MIKLAIIVLLSLNLHSLSDKQIERIKFVKEEARKYTKYPSTIAAMAIVESSAGKNRVGDKDKSLGILQVQVKTVRWLATMYPTLVFTTTLSDYDIEKLLLSNDRFSVEVACLYFEHYMSHGWGYTKSIMVYNGIPNNKLNWTYYNKVMKAKKLVRRLK